MAVDYAHPVIEDLYSNGTGTDWPGYLKDNIAAAAMWNEGLDPAGKRVGFKRINAGQLQTWNGTAWVALPINFGSATLGDPLTITSPTINLPNNAVTWQAPASLIYSDWKSTGTASTDYAELRVTSNDVIGRWVAYHSTHGSRPNQVWLQAFSANSTLVLGQNGVNRLQITPAGTTTVTGPFEAFSDNTNRFSVRGSAGNLYLDSLNAAGSAFLPMRKRGLSHVWEIGSPTPAIAMALNSSGQLSLSGNGSAYGGRLTVLPSVNPGSILDANQISIGEVSANNQYRLQLGYVNISGYPWCGSIQAYAANAPTSLIMQGVGGYMLVGSPLNYEPGGIALTRHNTGGGQIIDFYNVGTGASHTNSYEIGGVWASGWRDIANPAWCAGISFMRMASAGGLASMGDIVFQADSAGALTKATCPQRARIFGDSGTFVLGPGAANSAYNATGRQILELRGAVTNLISFQRGGVGSGYIHDFADSIEFVSLGNRSIAFTPNSTAALTLAYNGATFHVPVTFTGGAKSGRTWQTVSRAGNTDYVAPAYDIEVALTATTNANSSYIGIRVNGTVIVQAGNAGATNTILTVEGVTIPAGATYQYYAVGGISFNLVQELR